MKYNLLLIVILAACSPRNPYYQTDTLDQPYKRFFEQKQKRAAYRLTGKSEISQNVFDCLLPDSLGGKLNTGDCVLEIKLTEAMKIKEISVVGMTLSNRKMDTITQYDRYAQIFKKVHYKLYNGVEKYMPFINEIVYGFKLERLESMNEATGTAYCQLIFGSPSN